MILYRISVLKWQWEVIGLRSGWRILGNIEVVGVACSFTSMSQLMLTGFVSIDSAGNGRSSGFGNASDVFSLLEEMLAFLLLLVFASFLGYRSCFSYYLCRGGFHILFRFLSCICWIPISWTSGLGLKLQAPTDSIPTSLEIL